MDDAVVAVPVDVAALEFKARMKKAREDERARSAARRSSARAEVVRRNNVTRSAYERGGLRAVNRLESNGFGGVNLGAKLKGLSIQVNSKEVQMAKIGEGKLPNISAKEGRSILKHIGAGFDFSKAMGDFSRRVLEAVKDDLITQEEADELNEAASKVVLAGAALAVAKRGQ